jgi:hypothetical protein
MNLASPNGAKWVYGELKVTKGLGKHAEVSYHAALRNNGELKPRIEHRANLCYKF